METDEMHLTILSKKLASLTDKQFLHEFRVVHTSQTIGIATNLGIILQYVQGLALPVAKKSPVTNLPLDKPGHDYHSFARLAWPSLEVMQGYFSTADYQNTAGKHIFAEPFAIFLTEPLGPAFIEERENPEIVRVIVNLKPENDDEHFQDEWDTHASFWQNVHIKYARHKILNLDDKRVQKIFAGTQFDPQYVARRGGYEEFVFDSEAEATAFFQKYAQDLCRSYTRFANVSISNCLAFDSQVIFDAADRGVWQVTAGLFVGTLLSAKVVLGF